MQPGEVIADRFEILSVAGSGGMGEVFRARDRATGETVAVKVLRDAHGDAERFAREARLLEELRHEAIVRYVARGETSDGSHWLAMEWLDGEDLQARLSRAQLTAAESVELARRAADALGAAHARGVVHRDVKPSNLFLMQGAITGLRLLDFGIARARGALGTRAMTRTGVALGTPGYMSPEQARGDRDLDARADVFSLGCVLHECLTGEPAFTGEHVLAILAKILLHDAPRLDDVLPDAPPALVDLLSRMLAKNPAHRPRDGTQVARALGSLAAVPSLRPVAPSTRPPALTTGEQRLVSVVVAVPSDATFDFTEAATVGVDDDGTATRLRDAARRHGATLDRLADGTYVSALSGAEAVDRAARVALALAATADLRVALATGRARMEGHLPFGEAIDRAADMVRGLAAPSAIDTLSAALLGSRFEVRLDGTTRLLVRECAREEPVRTLMGKPTVCVGRDRELQALDDYLDECIDEPLGRPVVLVAPVGVGKTRVAYEFVKRTRARKPDVEVWITRGDSTRAGAPLSLITQAIVGTAGVQDGEPIESRRAKITARVARNVPAAQCDQVALFLGEMSGTMFSDEASAPLRNARRDAMVMADQTRRAWEEFVIAECSAQPVLLVLDDLHWGDAATVSYIDSALRNLGERPWMILALARPDVFDQFPKLWNERGVAQIPLHGLARKASERLVSDVLGESVRAEIVATIVDRAAGNAFFLEELIRAVAEGKGDAVPETVLGIIEQRLASLDSEARRRLRAASILGGTFWDGAVQRLLGGADPRVGLRALAEMELVHARTESRFPGEREYAFRQDVLRAAAYAMLTDGDRTLGHKLAAEWLVDAGEHDALVIAQHHAQGAESTRAVEWFLRAARQALDANDYDAAVTRAERGIACGAEGETAGHLWFVQAEAHRWSGRFAEVERCSAEALARLPVGSSAWFVMTRTASRAASALGRKDRVVALAASIEHAPPLEDASADRARVLFGVATTCMLTGERDWARRLDAAAGDASDDLTAAARASFRARNGLFGGDVAAALREFDAAHDAFSRGGDERGACTELGNVGFCYALLGDHERAEVTLRETRAQARRMGLRPIEAATVHNLGPVLSRLGRHDEARSAEMEAVTALRTQGDARMEGGSRVYLAEILLAAGDLPGALAEARQATDLLGPGAILRSFALAVRGRMELACGDVAAARATMEEAMHGVDAVNEGESTIRLAYAEVLHASGDGDAARAAIDAARTRLLARAAKISDAALRESFLTRLPENARTLALATAWTRT